MSGLQGYSSPTPNHVLFSVSSRYADWFADMVKIAQVECFEDVHRFWGCYKGVHEASYCVTEKVFWSMFRTWPFIFSDQESVLILGTPQARNWRKARLLMLKTREYVDVGTWRSATREEATRQKNYTYCPERNLYWVCEENPPCNQFEREQREKQRVLKELIEVVRNVYMSHTDYIRVAERVEEVRKLHDLGPDVTL